MLKIHSDIFVLLFFFAYLSNCFNVYIFGVRSIKTIIGATVCMNTGAKHTLVAMCGFVVCIFTIEWNTQSNTHTYTPRANKLITSQHDNSIPCPWLKCIRYIAEKGWMFATTPCGWLLVSAANVCHPSAVRSLVTHITNNTRLSICIRISHTSGRGSPFLYP